MDITTNNLEAAILDQKVAGALQGKRYAFIAVLNGDGAWSLGVAVQNEGGYHPIDGKTFADMAQAREWANGLNEHIGHDHRSAAEIVASSMRRPIGID